MSREWNVNVFFSLSNLATTCYFSLSLTRLFFLSFADFFTWISLTVSSHLFRFFLFFCPQIFALFLLFSLLKFFFSPWIFLPWKMWKLSVLFKRGMIWNSFYWFVIFFFQISHSMGYRHFQPFFFHENPFSSLFIFIIFFPLSLSLLHYLLCSLTNSSSFHFLKTENSFSYHRYEKQLLSILSFIHSFLRIRWFNNKTTTWLII